MKKRVKVIMLPTEDLTSVIKQGTSSTLYYYSNPISADTKYSYANQHLSFVSDEELKDGEWCYKNSMKKGNKVFKYDSSNIWHKGAYKIVATTDKSLVYLTNNGRVAHNLPQIPESFIKHYCEVGGIDEVEIEYMENFIDAYTEDRVRRFYGKHIIKVDFNNCVIIHPIIKESWNREELITTVIDLFLKEREYREKYSHFIDREDLTEWINKNL